MKRTIICVAVAMLCASPVFAHPADGSASQSATVSGSGGQATQTNVINRADITDTTVINNGRNNTSDMGVVENQGGRQTNVINQAQIKDTTVINNGENNSSRMGGVYNKQ